MFSSISETRVKTRLATVPRQHSCHRKCFGHSPGHDQDQPCENFPVI